jgi:hypothetical protein
MASVHRRAIVAADEQARADNLAWQTRVALAADDLLVVDAG